MQYLDGIINKSTDNLKQEISRLRESVESKNEEISELKATSNDLRDAFETLKTTIDGKNKLIADLNLKVVDSIRRNIQLSAKVDEIHDSLTIAIDDQQQYSRKNSLRIEGINASTSESNAELSTEVAKALNSLGADVDTSDFFRLHRSGRPHKSKDGRLVAQCIVRFNSWAARTRAFDTRFAGTRDERLKKPYFVRPDLTKRRMNLLKLAQDALADNKSRFAFADAECRLQIKDKPSGDKLYFNTPNELNSILASFGGQTETVACANAGDLDELGANAREMAKLWSSAVPP